MLQGTFMRQSFCRLILFIAHILQNKEKNKKTRVGKKQRIKNEKLQIGREVVASPTLRKKNSIKPSSFN